MYIYDASSLYPYISIYAERYVYIEYIFERLDGKKVLVEWRFPNEMDVSAGSKYGVDDNKYL